MIKERRIKKNITNKREMEKYRRLRMQYIENARKKRKYYLNNICQDINIALKLRLMDKAYRMVRRFFGEQKVKTANIKKKIVVLYMK